MGDVSTTPARPPRSLTVAACLGVYLAYFDRATPAAAAPLLKRALAIDDARLGFAIATAAALGYAAVAIALAAAGDRAGRRADRLMIGGVALWTAGMAALAFAPDFGLYVGAELIVGAGQALFVPAAATLIASAAGGARLGRSTARFTIASSLGRTSGTLIAGAILAVVIAGGGAALGLPATWRAVFLVTAIPNLVIAGALIALPGGAARGDVTDVAEREEATGETNGLRRIGAFLVATAPVLLIQAVAGWYPTLLVRTARLTPADAAMAAGAAMLVAAPAGQWLGGVAFDRRPRWRRGAIGVIAAMLAAAGAVLAGVALAPTLASALAALVVVDLALGVAALAALASIQTVAPAAGRHRVNSLFFGLVTVVGVGAGPLLAGRLSDLGGAGGGALAWALAEVAAIAVAVALTGAGLARGAPHSAAMRVGRA